MTGGVQLPLSVVAEFPPDPVELARLPILERAATYRALDLDPIEAEAAEAAVRLVRRGEYPREPV